MSKYLLFLLFSLTFNMFSQTDELWKIFDEKSTAKVFVTIDPAKLNWIYANQHSDSEHVASVRYVNNFINEQIDSIGFRLRGATSRESKKKSFKISFNSFVKGRKFYGVEKLNLNGEHNDPSITRSKLAFDLYEDIGVIASRASHAELYINNKYYGLYVNVEHIDEEFLKRKYADDSGNLWKCVYPANLIFINDDPNTYKNMWNGSNQVYGLSTNEEKGDYSKIIKLMKLLAYTPQSAMADSLEKYLKVDGVLKYLAMNVLLGGWDDYRSLSNNYYLYHEPSIDKIHLIPYDYDNTFGVDWFNVDWAASDPYNVHRIHEGAKPLSDKIMAVPEYKNLYTHFIKFYKDNVFKLDLWRSRLDSIKNMIRYSAYLDTFKNKDYGFTITDFDNSYSEIGYNFQHVKYGIKQFVNKRIQTLGTQLYYVTAKPIAYDIKYYPENPKPGDSIYVYVAAFSNNPLIYADLMVKTPNATAFTKLPLKFAPIANTKKVEESDRYVAVISPAESGTIEFYVVLQDNGGVQAKYPRTGSITIKTGGSLSSGLVINEFLADNLNSGTDSYGDHDDFIEIYNPTSEIQLLTGKYLSDNPLNLKKWQFITPNVYVPAGGRVLVWCDEQSTQGVLHANFKLSKSGEFISLTDADGASVLDSFSFGTQLTDISYGRIPDGSNVWKSLTPTPGAANLVLTEVEDEAAIPEEFILGAYPNPFNPLTNIVFSIPERGMVSLELFDMLGRKISNLISTEMESGTHKYELNMQNLSSGVYYCKLNTHNFTKTIKLQLLK